MNIQKILQRMLADIRHFRFAFLCSLVFFFSATLLNLYAPLCIGTIIDRITAQKTPADIFSQSFLLIIVYLLYSLTIWGMMLATNHIAYSFGYAMRTALIKKLEKLPVSFYDTQDHGDLMTRFSNDVDLMADGLLQGLSTLLSGIVTVIAAIAFMFSINLTMTIIVILCTPLTFLVGKIIAQRSHKYFVAQANDLGHLNAHTQEMLHGLRTLKIYGQEAAAYQKFQSLNQTLYQSGQKSQFYGSLVNPSTRLVTNMAYTIVGVSGAILALSQRISIGNISSFLLYSNQFSKPFNEISGVMTQLQSAMASAQRVFALLDTGEESSADSGTITSVCGHISFSHVSFGYDPYHLLMQDLCLDIPAGSRIAIVGRTGAGKTTFINLLMRFYELNSGVITLDGTDITKMSREDLRCHFGMVLQDTFLGEDSIYQIIAYGKKNATKEEIIQAAKQSGAHEFIKKLPQGYDTQLNSNSFLSQGQRQLLSITRVMLMDPAILILDEATSNMDTRSEAHVNAAMEKLMQGKTCFVIAHRLSTIIDSDRILVMEQGSIIEQGTHEELLTKQGAYASLYNSQFIHPTK